MAEIKNKDLKRRILEISHKHHLSHLGSCLTAVDIIDEIFATKKPDEKFILSSGHAGLALYVVLEKYSLKVNGKMGDNISTAYHELNAEDIFNHHGVHPDRCYVCGIDCSTGSLGQGLPIAVGMALADRSKNVYCLISDGECAEGSITESFNIWRANNLTNLKIYLNYNGFGAYGVTRNFFQLTKLGVNVIPTDFEPFQFLNGLDAHYHVMTDEEYQQAMEILK